MSKPKTHVFSADMDREIEDGFLFVCSSMQSKTDPQDTSGSNTPSGEGFVVAGGLGLSALVLERAARKTSARTARTMDAEAQRQAEKYSRSVRATQDLHAILAPKEAQLADLLNGETLDSLKAQQAQISAQLELAQRDLQGVLDDFLPPEVQGALKDAEAYVNSTAQQLENFKNAGFQEGCYEIGKNCTAEEISAYKNRLKNRCAETGAVCKEVNGNVFRYNDTTKKWDIPVKKTLLDVSCELRNGSSSIIELPKTEAARLFVAEEVSEAGKPLRRTRKADSNSAQKVVEKCSRPATGKNASRTLAEAQKNFMEATRNLENLRKSFDYRHIPEYVEAQRVLNNVQKNKRLLDARVMDAEKLTREITRIRTNPVNEILLETEVKTGRSYTVARGNAERARSFVERGKSVGNVGTAFRVGGVVLMGLSVTAFVSECVDYFNLERSFFGSENEGKPVIDGRVATSGQMSDVSQKLFNGDENKIVMFMSMYALKHWEGNITQEQWATYIENMGTGQEFSLESEVRLRQALLNAYARMPDAEKVTFLEELYQENKDNPNQDIPNMLQEMKDRIQVSMQSSEVDEILSQSTERKKGEAATTTPTEQPAPQREAPTTPTEQPAPQTEATTTPMEQPAPQTAAITTPTEQPAPQREATTTPTEQPAMDPVRRRGRRKGVHPVKKQKTETQPLTNVSRVLSGVADEISLEKPFQNIIPNSNNFNRA